MTARTYPSPAAFKQALEQRLRATWKTGSEFARRRQLLVFDRFLARVVTVLGDAVTLKGGLVVELRLERARTTRDVNLRLTGSPDDVLAKLQTAARLDLDDFLTFEIARDAEHPDINGDGVLAEKLHAYTMPRARPNSRVKDLPDIALLAGAGALDATRLRAAFEQTFAFRKTHALPTALPSPPPAWETPYAAMAREDRLAWTTLADVTAAAKTFLDPVLAGDLATAWDSNAWRWNSR